jgi:hypothetical protein
LLALADRDRCIDSWQRMCTGHPGEARAPASVGRRTDQGKSGDIRLDLRCGRQIHHRASRRTVHRIDLMLC